jgi:hypothetical protein
LDVGWAVKETVSPVIFKSLNKKGKKGTLVKYGNLTYQYHPSQFIVMF